MIEICIFEEEHDFSLKWKSDVRDRGGIVDQFTGDLFEHRAREIPHTQEDYLVAGIWIEECIVGLVIRLLSRNRDNIVTIDLARTRSYEYELEGEKLPVSERENIFLMFPTIKKAASSGRVLFD